MGKIGWLFVLGVCMLLGTFDVLGWYRTLIFNLLYANKCPQAGYLEAAKTFDLKDLDVEISGRSFLITGANSGIGKSTALMIAQKGGTLHMVCRNPESAERARREIVAKSGNEDVYVHILDVSNIKDVHHFAQKLNHQVQKLDVLINNAAIMKEERILTSEGLEVNFATNTMAYYVLTIDLLPLLKKSKDPRVIMVSSNCLLEHKLVVDDFQHDQTPFFGETVYCQQKRQQLVTAEELAKIHPHIQFSSADPGWVDTPAVRRELPEIYERYKKILRTPEQGADTIFWLAASESALTFENGLLYVNRSPVPTHLPFAFTKETKSDRKKLMDQLDEISNRLKKD